jgi:hypothetical protein
VIDEKNRELVLSVEQPLTPGSFDNVYSLLRFNLDTHQFTIITFPDLWPCAMVRPPHQFYYCVVACARVRVRWDTCVCVCGLGLCGD